MEFFEKAVAVRLKSHLDKYLVAGDDHHTVRQSRTTGSTPAARWLIEHVDTNHHVIRLKSCYGRYLTACSTPVLLGTTGNKIIQSVTENLRDLAIEWQPVRDGFQFKLKSSVGTYLRANGSMPPWRNTVTHDGSFTSSTNNWILWDVEAVDVVEDESVNNCLSIIPSFPAVSGEYSDRELLSPVTGHSSNFSPPSPAQLMKKVKIFRGRMTVTNTQFQTKLTKLTSYACHSFAQKIPHFRLNSPIKFIKKNHMIQHESEPPSMDLLRNAKVVRLRSRHGKYLHANNDQESVSQDSNRTALNNRWTIEFVDDTPDNITIIRLKSCYDKYLTASDHPFLFGLTGKKVLQSMPTRLDSSVEWEPIEEGKHVKLKTRYGHYLRGNGGLPPWRNSVTHDIPYRTATKEWIMWQIDIVDTNDQSLQLVPYTDSFTSASISPTTSWSKSPTFSKHESIDSPLKIEEGRAIHYRVISDNFGETEENGQGFCISFKGNEVNELTRMLEEETRLHNITVCSQSPLDGKLYPLRLQLPPNNVTMKVVVVQNSSEGEKQYRFKVRSSSRSSYGGYF
ncbi:hypothetical protein L1987_72843 [Smallanthus sonchifolius]|uniref:Uncharacterized protein n=1 Tax=Smallanthus sonchifolius TaxID=185202 RepID=A0ACB9AWD5_9ASTR|nr:hypothetical protein L1987_72843 [Smallanthus sonchifolius]